ncbi:MAG: restriction endonuclease subunit S [Mycobacterium sp.]
MTDRTAPLGDLITITRGKTYKSALLGQPGPVLLGLASIARNGGFRGDSLRTYGGDSPENLLVRPSEIFASLKDVTQSADLLGSVARVPANGPTGRLTQDTVRLDVASDEVDADYLYLALLTPTYREYCRSHATGTTNLGLPRDDFLAYEVRLPSLTEQRRIAAVLGAMDDLIEANRRTVQNLDSQAEVIFERSVAAQDGSAEIVTLSHLVERGDLVLSDGYRTRSDQLGEPGLPILRVADVLDAEIVPSYKDHILESFRSRMGVKVSKPRDVLITTKGTVGRIALVQPDLPEHAYSPQLCFLRATNADAFSAEWLYRWARSAEFLRQIGIVKDQTDMAPYVSLTDLRRVEMTLPAPSVRRAVESQLAPLTIATEELRAEIAELVATRDELLPLLMSGKVRVSADLAVA